MFTIEMPYRRPSWPFLSLPSSFIISFFLSIKYFRIQFLERTQSITYQAANNVVYTDVDIIISEFNSYLLQS